MRAHAAPFLVAVVLCACGNGACGDDAPGIVDASVDAPPANIDAGGPAATVPTPAAPPSLTPCPDGWSEAVGPNDVTICEPFSADTPADCAEDEIIWPGQASCRSLSGPCPADGFATDLPAGEVVYVRAGATAGDGSRAAPFGVLVDALAAAPIDSTVALAAGTYEAGVRLSKSLTIVGACLDVVIDGLNRPAFTVDAGLVLRDLRLHGNEGVRAHAGSHVVAHRVIIEDTTLDGVNVLDGTFEGEEVIIRRTGQLGLSVTDGTGLSLRRSMFSDNAVGVVDISGADLLIEDVVAYRSGLARIESPIIAAFTGTDLIVRRAAFIDDGSDLVLLSGIEHATLEDVVFAGKAPGEAVAEGGILAFGGSNATLSRVRLERTRTLGIAVADSSSHMLAEDVIIAEPQATALGRARAIEVGANSMLEARRVLIVGARDVALLATGLGGALQSEDLTILGTRENSQGTMGRALQVQSGATAVIDRTTIAGNREASVVAATAGSSIILRDATITGTLARACVDRGCPPAGIGVASYEGGSLQLERFAIRGNSLAGLQIANGGSVTLDDGEVSDQPVGANVQDADYDISRLMDGVFYLRNGINLDSRALPVPEAIVPTSGP